MSNKIPATRVAWFTKRIAGCGLIGLAAVWLFTSCHRRDVQITQDIAGIWKSGATEEMHIYPEGNFRAKSVLTSLGGNKIWNYDGLWQVQNGVFIALITNSFALNYTNFEESGSTNQYTVIKVDKTSLVWQLDGQTTTWDRR